MRRTNPKLVISRMCKFECHGQADWSCSHCNHWGCYERGHLIICEQCESPVCEACFDRQIHGRVLYFWPCCVLTPQPSFELSVGTGCVAAECAQGPEELAEPGEGEENVTSSRSHSAHCLIVSQRSVVVCVCV